MFGPLCKLQREHAKAKLFGSSDPAVLLRYDMFHMVGEFAIFLAQTAGFATFSSPGAHKSPRCRIDLLWNVRPQLLARSEL